MLKYTGFPCDLSKKNRDNKIDNIVIYRGVSMGQIRARSGLYKNGPGSKAILVVKIIHIYFFLI